MTEDNRIPNFWWCPTHHLYRGGDKRPCADAVRLVPAPPAPRVFFPGDTVPGDLVVIDQFGQTFRERRLWVVSEYSRGVVEVLGLPSPDDWQATVDRAKAARADSEHNAEGAKP